MPRAERPEAPAATSTNGRRTDLGWPSQFQKYSARARSQFTPALWFRAVFHSCLGGASPPGGVWQECGPAHAALLPASIALTALLRGPAAQALALITSRILHSGRGQGDDRGKGFLGGSRVALVLGRAFRRLSRLPISVGPLLRFPTGMNSKRRDSALEVTSHILPPLSTWC